MVDFGVGDQHQQKLRWCGYWKRSRVIHRADGPNVEVDTTPFFGGEGGPALTWGADRVFLFRSWVSSGPGGETSTLMRGTLRLSE